jgi:hypothetical protein
VQSEITKQRVGGRSSPAAERKIKPNTRYKKLCGALAHAPGLDVETQAACFGGADRAYLHLHHIAGDMIQGGLAANATLATNRRMGFSKTHNHTNDTLKYRHFDTPT